MTKVPSPCSRCGRTIDGMPLNEDGSRRVTICNGFCDKLQAFERYEQDRACDCQAPVVKSGAALVSEDCPIHAPKFVISSTVF